MCLKCEGGGGRRYILGTHTYWKCMFCCMSVLVCVSLCSFMFQFCLRGSFTTLDNFITAHLVLFILITQAAKHRLRIQAVPGLHYFSHSLSSALLAAAFLPSCFCCCFVLHWCRFKTSLWLWCVTCCYRWKTVLTSLTYTAHIHSLHIHHVMNALRNYSYTCFKNKYDSCYR